jgi:N-acyl-D-amino-acid deacylase
MTQPVAKLTDPQMRARFAHSLQYTPLDTIHIAWVAGAENKSHQGKNLSDYVAEIGLPPADALCNLLIEENLAVLLVFHYGDDRLIGPFLAHDKYMMGSDGIYHPDGAIHPRQYGSAPRLLGPCVRDWQLYASGAVNGVKVFKRVLIRHRKPAKRKKK